ncbi:MAG: hypothetical protein GOV15_03695, partial [Candidatus Diapherotrites archaeon]|nr:hypothetical protein [Candidatus Diapherotrites archaeon]
MKSKRSQSGRQRMPRLTAGQLENIIEWSGGKELSIPEAQKQAMFAYLKEKGLIPKDKLETLFGQFQGRNKAFVTTYLEKKKIIPIKLLALLKLRALTLIQLSEKTNTPVPEINKLLLDLATYQLIVAVSRNNALFKYLETLKNYSIGRFKHKLIPWVQNEVLEAYPLAPKDLWVWKKNESTYSHALKSMGRELFLLYANSGAKTFADKYPTSRCLPDMIKELFGITIREVSFLKTPTNVKEMEFEVKFRTLVSSIVQSIDSKAHCTDEEFEAEEGVYPDILVTQTRNKKAKLTAIELKKAARGHLVDCSIKQFLKYVEVYDYTGILTFYDLPGVALHLGNKKYTGEAFMQALKDYYAQKTKEMEVERNKFRRAIVTDPEFCDKVKATNTFLAYRLSH